MGLQEWQTKTSECWLDRGLHNSEGLEKPLVPGNGLCLWQQDYQVHACLSGNLIEGTNICMRVAADDRSIVSL